MQQLKLVGPQDGHTNLVLEATDGTRFLLAADSELRTAVEDVQVPKPAPKRPVDASNYPEELSPRDIQSRIREGSSVEDIVYAYGMDQKYVERYAQPVLDERRYMVQLAQQVQVADSLPEQERFPTLHPEPASLLAMVQYQLKSLNIPLDSLEWDAWRDVHNTWHIQATFAQPEQGYLFADQEPEARWYFQPGAKQLENANQWAQALSEEEPLDDPIAGQHLKAVPELDEGEKQHLSQDERDALLELLRERRGTRLGSDEDSDDELANFIARGFDPQDQQDESDAESDDNFGMPRPEESELEGPRGLVRHIDFGVHKDQPTEEQTTSEDEPATPPPVPAAKKHAEIRGQTDALQAAAEQNNNEQPATKQDQNQSNSGAQPKSSNEQQVSAEEDQAEEEKPLKQVLKKKPRRSSVPSWDEIVFGTKGES